MRTRIVVVAALLALLGLAPSASAIEYEVYCSNAGVPATGLTPTWAALKLRSSGANQSQPAITEVGGGWYKYAAAPTTGQVWIGAVDCGATLLDADRYVAVRLAPEDVFLDRATSLLATPTDVAAYLNCLQFQTTYATEPNARGVTQGMLNGAPVVDYTRVDVACDGDFNSPDVTFYLVVTYGANARQSTSVRADAPP